MNGLLRSWLVALGGMTLLSADGIRQAFRRPFERALWLEQLEHLGVQSITITNVTLLFTGMVLAVQTAYSLASYGGQSFVGNLLGLAIVRELGPVLTALMVAGRVGAGITAELGSMAVTEQVDALRVLAASPTKKLVVPRVGALVIALPLLTVLADAIGLFGGLVMAVTQIGQPRAYFVSHILLALTVYDVVSGIGKTFFFAFFIGIIACYNGLNATGGADGVGKATTNTVVVASIAVIISDFFLTQMFLMF
ncbi:MAG TPA: ABC transporter permease [Candidatus Sulfotelmatobacter sp.]|jgi:phospholipid/cholesterol/gamma-HCH transport system permease protein|nr:ABC transporter permease [Candidatus Sulfotelmatobacter sp.]